jgi:predicted DCC family thiol-disulfide oxidoreductase YuxK
MNNASTTAWQFTFFRILFGIYLAVHFAMLAPFAPELFGSEGMMGNPALNPTAGIFPNPLDLHVPGTILTMGMEALAICSLLFAAGALRRTMAVLLWFGWTALFHRNNLISNPSIPYIGLLLLLSVLVPAGEPLSFARRAAEWEMPRWVVRCAWILMAAGYTFSGITKLASPSWIDGSAMGYLLENPLARPGIARSGMLHLPALCLQLLTWLTLLVELAFLPLALWGKSRPWIWLTLVLMHLGIILVVDFADLSLGMLMIHAFTFDRRWIPSRHAQVVMAYDGECLMCSRVIRFIAAEDRGVRVKFIALQSGRGREMAAIAGSGELGSMIVDADGAVFLKSAAVLVILSALGGHWRLLSILGGLIPGRPRDAAYDFIAARRYRWFGKTTSCEIPPAEVRGRML